MVSGNPDSPACNCPDFENHIGDPEWRCKHILAVLNQREKRERSEPSSGIPQTQERPGSEPKASEPVEKKKSRQPRSGQQPLMTVKRSISPDGRINSVSVEFLNPIGGVSDEEIKQLAEKALRIQSEVVNNFFKKNGSQSPDRQPQEKAANAPNANGKSFDSPRPPANGSDGALPAQLLNIAGMDTRGGWKTFINVQVNGTTTKVFGTKRELGELITAAGFASIADHISQGMMLNLPCRVVTKRSQDGRYLNIERVFPLKPLEPNGRAGQ
jgi:hypothetical protein